MDHLAVDLSHVDYRKAGDPPDVGGLAAALGIEGRPVQDDAVDIVPRAL